MLKPTVIVAVAIILAVLTGGYWWWNQPCRSGCNVILIMVDTLSAQHLATYGYDRDTMPKTTAFFEKGLIFENANSSAPWTLPSFTGMYFSDIASHITYAELDNNSRPSLQSELRKGGVTIRAVAPGPIDNFIFDGITRLYKKEELFPATHASPLQLGGDILQTIAGTREPFFLLIHSFQVHDPYKPTAPFNEEYGSSTEYPVVTREDLINEYKGHTIDPAHADVFRLRYDQQILSLDDELAAFLNGIPESTLKNTIVILAADHGESFNEHSMLYHANDLFQEELHVPLMMRAPGAAARRVPDAVSLLDIAPTILSVMHIQIPERFLGKSLVPLFTGGKLKDREIFSVNGRPAYMSWMTKTFVSLEDAGAIGSSSPVIIPSSVGVRIGSERAFFEATPGTHYGIHWYDLASDPKEKQNLAAEGLTAMPKELLEPLRKLSKDFVAPLKADF